MQELINKVRKIELDIDIIMSSLSLKLRVLARLNVGKKSHAFLILQKSQVLGSIPKVKLESNFFT